MRKELFGPILSLCIVAGLLAGCSPRHSEIVVARMGPEKITISEYERFYLRNTGTWETARKSTLEERQNFLNLLTRYKLKLRDAYDRGLLYDPEVQSELQEYRTNLATTFLIEREITEPGLRNMYARRTEELRAKHILIRLAPDSSPEDTLKAWNRAIDLLNRLKQGEDFGQLAMQYSEDPSAQNNKGDLYYFTTGQMVPEFEEAAYKLLPGQISDTPVRTNFGYHLIKLTDRQPAVGSIRVRHIMIGTRGKEDNPEAMEEARQLIHAIRDSIVAGYDFAELAERHSDDRGSAPRGGDLGHFQRRRFVQEFEEVAFKLNPGELSEVVLSPFGYHVIKSEEVTPLGSFDELRAELLRTYQQQRYPDEYRRYVGALKEKFGETIYDEVLEELASAIDTTKSPWEAEWSAGVSPELGQKPVVTVGPRTFTVDDVVRLAMDRREFREVQNPRKNVHGIVQKAGDLLALEVEAANLEDRYPEFKELMREFQDGVVLYRAEQLEVWNRISINEASLREYFERHRDQFTFPDRVNITEISFGDESAAALIRDELGQEEVIDSVLARHQASFRPLKNRRGFVPADTDELTRLAWEHEEGEIIGPIPHRNRYTLVIVHQKDSQRHKTFEEAGAEVSTAFQDYEAKRLEREWLERLKRQYPVVENTKALKHAFAGEQAPE